MMMQISGSESLWESFKKKLLELHLLVIGVLSGTNYSRAWTICSTFSEVLERFVMSHFLWERNITFWMKLRSTLRKIIAMLLMTVSLIWSVLLLLSTNHIKKNYGAVNSVKHKGGTYPGLKTQLSEKEVSVQGQDCYPLRISVYQWREQTINKDAKTAGSFISQYLLNLTCQVQVQGCVLTCKI